MEKGIFYINGESLLRLGIDPIEAVRYLENKKAITINPVHVKAHQILKKQPMVPSS